MSAYDYAAPESLDEVIALLDAHGDDAHLIAGGASLILMLRQSLLTPSILVGLRRVPELRGIRANDDGSLRIAAMTSHRGVEMADEVAAYAPALGEAFGHVATVRVRNQGTVGGNLAHADPAQDPPPILMALDAVVHVRGREGQRSIPVTDLFVDYFETSLEPTEVITGVELPPRSPGAAAVYEKYLAGSRDDYATVSVAAAGTLRDGRWTGLRVACGAAGPVPMRLTAVEQALEGSSLTDTALTEAAGLAREAVDPIADVRGSAAYKREMAAVWVRRALVRLRAQAAGRSQEAAR